MAGEQPNYTDLVSNDPHYSRADRVVTRWWQHLDRPARMIWLTLGAMGTIGGAYGFVQIFVPSDPQTIGLSHETQAELLQMVAKGQLTPKQAQQLALAMTGQAFPETAITALADLPDNSEERRYADTVSTIAESRNAKRRAALAKIGADDSRAAGLAELAAFVKTPEHWREVGELAYPWNADLAKTAYEKVVASPQANVFDQIYLGRLYVRTGQTEAAAATLSKGLALNPNARDKLALLIEQGHVFTLQGNLSAAREKYQNGLAIARTLSKADPSNTGVQRDLSISYDRLGDVARAQGDLADARTYYEDTLSIARTLAEADPSNTEFQRDLSISYNRLGDVARAQGNLADARTYYEDSLAIRRTLAEADPSNTGFQRDLSVSYNRLGDVAQAQGNLADARTYYEDSLAIRRTLAEADPSNTGFQRDLSVSYNQLGDVARVQGDLAGGRTYYEDALSIARTLAEADPTNSGFQRDLYVSYIKLGDVARAQGDLADARTYYEDSLSIARTFAQADPSNTGFQRDLSISYDRLGDVARAQGDLSDARASYEDSLAITRTLAEADPSNAEYQRDLIISYAKLASLGGDEALDHWRAAREVVSALVANGKLRPVDAWMPDRIDAKISKLGG